VKDGKECVFEGVPFALAEAMLREAGEMRFAARGEGMLPAIFPGEELVVHRARLSDVAVGDVVLFAQKGQWFLERVREIVPGMMQPSLRTSEDLGELREEPVFAEELLGRVVFVVRDVEEMVMKRQLTTAQRMCMVSVKYMPGGAELCFAMRRMRSRIAGLRQHGVSDSLAAGVGQNL
jgi:hypothetical protein